ncbi:helix-turn-helix domain-containing protein [Vagococcus humatus]|uniref:Mga helix-turn-helix domain-containing protein n=1 Tax=Vagococcus humatus TaxID=1889241 RepID=A0A429Z894_9ENTE|nr:helix-turn-helix domain-containing protein [Vagococcus humatus]RST89855.1 hypothetical protein C7P63_01895 [Vagococcus humatus]
MKQLVMSKKDKTKLDMFKDILFSGQEGMFVQTLKKDYDLSQSTLDRYLREIQQDLQVTFDNVRLILSTTSGSYLILKDIHYSDGYIVETLSFHYMKHNSFFVVLQALIQDVYHSVEELARDLNLSSSNIYKQVRLLNELAAPFNISVDLSVNGSNFKGSELGIRYFFYYVYWRLYQTNRPLPFNQEQFQDLSDITHLKEVCLGKGSALSSSQIVKLRILQTVTLYKVIYRHKNICLEDEFYQDIVFLKNPNISIFDSVSHIYTEKELEMEKCFFCFATQGLIYDITPFDWKKQVVERYRQSELEIARQVEKLLEEFVDVFQFNYTEEGYYTSYYLLLIYLLYVKHVHIDAYGAEGNMSRPFDVKDFGSLKSQLAIERFVSYSIKQICPQKEFVWTEVLIQRLSHLFYTIYTINKAVDPVTILVQFTENNYLGEMIKANLANYFNDKLLVFVSDPAQADLVISDVYEPNASTQYHFYLDDIYDGEQSKKMFYFVSEYLYHYSFFRKFHEEKRERTSE